MGQSFSVVSNWPLPRRGRPCRYIGRRRNTFRILTATHVYCMRFVPRVGFHCYERSIRFSNPAPQQYVVRRWELPEVKKKLTSQPADKGNHRVAMETHAFRDLMPLVEHIGLTRYEDGDPRLPGWITIKTQGAAWCVQVKDPDSAMSFTAIGQTLDTALETAALMLSCDEAPWEPDQWLARSKPKGKKG